MKTEPVSFTSMGARLAGLLRVPDASAPPYPVVVHPPGWLGLAAQARYERYHRVLCGAGFAVLAFDYRGYGDSEGEAGWVVPDRQLEDVAAAVSYAETRGDLDARRIGIYGMGGTGGGNAILAAADDARIRCVVAQSVVADGADWLHRMRREHEWLDFLARVAADRRRRAAGEPGEMVDPRTELMVATPERAEGKAATDARLAAAFHLASADALLRYRPIDQVARIAPRALLLTAVEGDAVTPADHADALFARAGEPKKLVRVQGTHYGFHESHAELLAREIVGWFERHLAYDAVEVRDS